MYSKRALGLTMMAFAMMDPSMSKPNHRRQKEISADELAERKATAIIKQAKRKGLKKFMFGDNYVYAINKKVAIKKAKKRGYSL